MPLYKAKICNVILKYIYIILYITITVQQKSFMRLSVNRIRKGKCLNSQNKLTCNALKVNSECTSGAEIE